LKALSEGSFGKVYLAEMVTGDAFSTVVAIKLLHGKWLGHEEIVMRSRDEARLLGLLRHQNIIRVEDLSSINGQCAVIMEYLDGVDLKAVISYLEENKKPFPRRTALELGSSIASALDAAYNHRPLQGGPPLRVIHRDIKPSNVMVTPAGAVKVLDFGTARANFEDREAQTMALAFGSQAYMAPERMMGDPDTPAADVFSLGVTIWELLATCRFGKIFIRESRYQTALEQRVAALNLSSLDDQLAEDLRALLLRMMDYEPEARPTADEAMDTLEEYAELCPDMSMRRFCRAFVPEMVKLRPEMEEYGDPLTGTTLVEDRSSAFAASSMAGQTWSDEALDGAGSSDSLSTPASGLRGPENDTVEEWLSSDAVDVLKPDDQPAPPPSEPGAEPASAAAEAEEAAAEPPAEPEPEPDQESVPDPSSAPEPRGLASPEDEESDEDGPEKEPATQAGAAERSLESLFEAPSDLMELPSSAEDSAPKELAGDEGAQQPDGAPEPQAAAELQDQDAAQQADEVVEGDAALEPVPGEEEPPADQAEPSISADDDEEGAAAEAPEAEDEPEAVPGDQPGGEPVDGSAEASEEGPAADTEEEPGEEPGEEPVEEPAEDPSGDSREEPESESVEASEEISASVSDEASDAEPEGEEAGEPDEEPDEEPEEESASKPALVRKEEPAALARKEEPAAAPEVAPAEPAPRKSRGGLLLLLFAVFVIVVVGGVGLGVVALKLGLFSAADTPTPEIGQQQSDAKAPPDKPEPAAEEPAAGEPAAGEPAAEEPSADKPEQAAAGDLGQLELRLEPSGGAEVKITSLMGFSQTWNGRGRLALTDIPVGTYKTKIKLPSGSSKYATVEVLQDQKCSFSFDLSGGSEEWRNEGCD